MPIICEHHNATKLRGFDRAPLYECKDCGLIFSDKYGKALDSRAIYNDYYKNEISSRFRFGVEWIIRAFRYFRALKVYTIGPRAKSILDIGSGRGFMLYYLKKYFGYKRAAGTQISKNAYEFSKNRLKLEIYDQDLLEAFPDQPGFDIVTMWHVLEHVAEPERYIEKIGRLLKPGGKIIIEVPNFDSWSRRFTGSYWLGLDPSYHITYFTPVSLARLLENYGFKTKVIHPFSLEYSTFISAQSFTSLLTGTDHLLFRYLQEGDFSLRLLLHVFLIMLLSPICFLINILFYFSSKGEVLLVVGKQMERTSSGG